MKLWVVTGGIGTGKSTVARRLQSLLGGEVDYYSADEEVAAAYHRIDIAVKVRKQLGIEIGPGGINAQQRRQLRDLITKSKRAKESLEAILHPITFEALQDRVCAGRQAGRKVLVAEIPLHYETGRDVAADCIVVVAASRASQIARLQKSRGLDEGTAAELINLQIPISTKVDRADVVIWNDGSLLAMERQIDLLSKQLLYRTT